MIPEFDDGEFLPGGNHEATWKEVQDRFASNEHRQHLASQLGGFLDIAKRCGFLGVYLFGSFISGKDSPGDIDLLWIYRSETFENLGPSCRELLNYETMKRRMSWDMFCCSDTPGVSEYLIEGFKRTKNQTRERGIIFIDLLNHEVEQG